MSYHLCTLPRGRMSVSSWNSVVHFATHSRTLSLFPVTFFALLSKGILFKEEIGGEKHMVHPNTRADLTFHGTECMHSDNLLGWEDLSSGIRVSGIWPEWRSSFLSLHGRIKPSHCPAHRESLFLPLCLQMKKVVLAVEKSPRYSNVNARNYNCKQLEGKSIRCHVSFLLAWL